MNHPYYTRSKAALEKKERAIKENEDRIIKEREKEVDLTIERMMRWTCTEPLQNHLIEGLSYINKNDINLYKYYFSTILKNIDTFLRIHHHHRIWIFDTALNACNRLNDDWVYAAIYKRRFQDINDVFNVFKIKILINKK